VGNVLTGVDYFSALGYQPGIAVLAAGAAATLSCGDLDFLVLLTLFGHYQSYPACCQKKKPS